MSQERTPEQSDIERLREALAFYADPETYVGVAFIADPPCGEIITDESDTGEPWGWRLGKRARAALESKKI